MHHLVTAVTAASFVLGRKLFARGKAMADDRATRRKHFREMLAELRNAALAELESRGYEVRGKTPIEIRQILKRRRSKQKSIALTNHQTTTATTDQNTTASAERTSRS
jgi:uncharacterized protein YbjQ (UPF0145 family)